MTLTISLSLNATLTDGQRSRTIALPLLWLTAPLDRWQRWTRRIRTTCTLAGIMGRSLAWGLL